MEANVGRSSGAPEPVTEVSLWSYLNVLIRWWRIVFIAPVAVAFVVATLSLNSPRQYRSIASFAPQRPSSAQGAQQQLSARLGIAAPTDNTTSPQFFADLLASRAFLESLLLSKYSVVDDSGHSGTLLDYLGMTARTDRTSIVQALPKVQGILHVSVNSVTGVITLQVLTPYPRLSEEVALRSLELINEFNLRRRQALGRAEREFIQDRLEDARVRLVAAEDALASFHARNRSISSPDIRVFEARLQRSVDLRQELYVSLAQRLEMAIVDEVRNTPAITITEDPTNMVEPAPRNTIRKTFLALVLGFGAAVGVAFIAQYFAVAATQRDEGYLEFRRRVATIAKALPKARSN